MPKELTQAPESLFWYWITERHSIYLKRQAGQDKPWTQDSILQHYKFTNPFRENDRGTVWLRENFLQPHKDAPLEQLAFNICWYRMFNWWGTGKLLGWQTNWDTEVITEKLAIELRNGRQVFTGAHIVYSPPGRSKIAAIVEVCGNLRNIIYSHGFLNTIHYQTLEAMFDYLQTVYCVGGFMAYEMVTDMRHTRIFEDATDIMTWANPGPGAKRGLQRLGMAYKKIDEAIASMQELLSHNGLYRHCIPLTQKLTDFPDLEMRDIEHSLCEFDKYCRVKFGEGKPRGVFNGI